MTHEHTVAIVSFEGALKREMKRLRRTLAQCEDLAQMCLEIKCSGRLHDGDLILKYAVGEYSSVVEADSLDAAADEFLRRHGWKQTHSPKAIGYERIPSDDTEESEDDEIPF